MYLRYDQLEAAAELVLEYVDALLGKGHQYFGIEVSGGTNTDLLLKLWLMVRRRWAQSLSVWYMSEKIKHRLDQAGSGAQHARTRNAAIRFLIKMK